MNTNVEDLINRADAALESNDISALVRVEMDAKAMSLLTRNMRKYLDAIAKTIAERKFG